MRVYFCLILALNCIVNWTCDKIEPTNQSQFKTDNNDHIGVISYSSKQICKYDSLYSESYGKDTVPPALTLYIANPATAPTFIKIYTIDKANSTTVTTTEYGVNHGKLTISSHVEYKFYMNDKTEAQIKYLLSQLNNLTINSPAISYDLEPVYFYYYIKYKGVDKEVSLSASVFAVENNQIYHDLLTGIWLLTSTKLYHTIFEHYLYTVEQSTLLR